MIDLLIECTPFKTKSVSHKNALFQQTSAKRFFRLTLYMEISEISFCSKICLIIINNISELYLVTFPRGNFQITIPNICKTLTSPPTPVFLIRVQWASLMGSTFVFF